MSFLNVIMKKNGDLYSAVWAIVAAFGTYFCMYGFRKPFTSAGYSEIEFFGFDFKTILVIHFQNLLVSNLYLKCPIREELLVFLF